MRETAADSAIVAYGYVGREQSFSFPLEGRYLSNEVKTMTVLENKKVGFIGAGNMAGALAGGLIKSYLVEKTDVMASDVDPERRAHVELELGIKCTANNLDVVEFADILILGVKPQILPVVLEEIGGSVRPDQIVISICAGISSAFIESHLDEGTPVLRVMPNSPAMVGAGVSAISCGSHATKPECEIARAILGAVGSVIELDEKHIDAVTAISGSGPAYFFYLMEAMEAAALAEGLLPGVALELVKQTALGAAKLAVESAETPRDLRRQVTSPGGTTEAGIHFFNEKKVNEHLVEGVRRAAARSRELGS